MLNYIHRIISTLMICLMIAATVPLELSGNGQEISVELVDLAKNKEGKSGEENLKKPSLKFLSLVNPPCLIPEIHQCLGQAFLHPYYQPPVQEAPIPPPERS